MNNEINKEDEIIYDLTIYDLFNEGKKTRQYLFWTAYLRR